MIKLDTYYVRYYTFNELPNRIYVLNKTEDVFTVI